MFGTVPALAPALRRCAAMAIVSLAMFGSAPAFAQSSAVNTATITAPAGVTDPDTANNSATDSDPIVAPLLAIAKTHAGDFSVGIAGSYNLVVTNTGTSPTVGTITVTDPLPPGLTFVSGMGAGWTCVVAVQNVTCTTTAVLAPNAAGSPISVQVNVAASAIPSVTNIARVAGGGDATCPLAPATPAAHCGASDPTTVGGVAALTLVKTASAVSFEVGVSASYTLVVTNGGSAATTAAASIADTVPTGLTIGTLPAGCVRNPGGGQTVVCTVASGLAPGATASVVIPVTPAASTAGTTLANSATVRGGGDPLCPATGTTDARCTGSVDTPVTGAVNLTLVKTGPATANTATTFSYSLILTNSGSVATGASVVVQDQLPAGVVATAAVGATCAPLNAAGALLNCAVPGPIAAGGGTATITLTVTAPTTAGAITNYASTNVNGTGSPATPPGAGCASNATVSCANAPTDIVLPPAQAFDFCAANTIWNITGSGLGTPTATAQSPRYTIGGAETLVPALDRLIPNGSFNGNMVDPVRNRLMFYNRTGTTSQLWAYDAANGGWYVGATFTSVDIPRAGMNQAGIGYLIGGGASPPVYRVTSSSQFGYTVAAAGNLTYSATPTDLGSGDIAFDAGGNGWMVVGQDVWKISAASLAANAPVAVRQQRPVLNGTPINFSLAGIAFGSDDKLYVANVGPTPASGYYALDLNTSVLTRVANATGARDLASCAFPVLVPTVLGVTKTLAQVNGAPYVAGAAVRPGDTLTYGITVAYKSGELAATIFAGDVVDTLPANTAVVTTGNDFTCSGSSCTNTAVRTLQPGGNTTFNFVVKVNDALPANTAAIGNAVTVKNVDCAAAGNDCAEVTPIGPIVGVAKTAPATVLAGGVLTYSLTVTNSGATATPVGVVVQDQLPAGVVATASTGATCVPLPSAAGALLTCTLPAAVAANGTAAFTITTTAPATGGDIVNYAATSTSGTGNPGTPPGSGCTSNITTSCSNAPTTVQAPGVSVVKTAGTPVDVNANGLVDVGDTIPYTFVVSNTGNVALNGVVVNDAKLSTAAIPCTPATIPAGGTANCGPVSYTITTADQTAGTVDNSATATGTPTGGTPVTSAPSTTSTPVTPAAPALTLVKTAGTPVDANGNGITDAGDTIAYTFVVTNAGNVPLNGVAIDDAKLSPTPIACAPANVPVGGTANCGPVVYAITTADQAAGSVDNSATATATPPGGTPLTSAPSTTSTPVTPAAPALTLVKSAGAPVDANANGITDAGDTIAYSFVVTNTGNVALNGVVVTDTKLSATPIACTPANVPAGGTANCGPLTYTVTAADQTSGSVDNSATASGTPPGGTPVTSPPSTTSTPIVTPNAALTLVKSAGTPVDTNANGVTDAGDTIAYSFVVTNGGNVPLTGVVIDDAKLSATPIACTPATVPANGGTANCGPVTYTITATDEAASNVANSATATGTPPGGTPVTSPPSTTDTPVTPADAALTLFKTAGTPVDTNANGITDAGDTIAYTFMATNTGNVPLNGVVVNDTKLSATPIACTPATVPVGGTANCGPVGYTITAADETAGSVDNSATATGTPPGGTPVTSEPATTSTPTDTPAPALTVVKSAGTPVDTNANGITDAGDTIAYTFAVTNGGNVPLNDVVIDDAKISATPIACTPATVPANGGTADCGPVTYTITAVDEAAGNVANSATATGTPPGGTPVTSPPSTTDTPVTPADAALTVVKSAGTPVDTNANGITDAGDTIAYTFAITNDGNVPLSGVVVNDAKLSATPIACTPATVAANGGTATCGPVTYTITSADETAGNVDNSATATGTPPGGTPVTSDPSTTSTPVTSPDAALSLVKTAGTPVDTNANGITDAGDTIAYSFVVSNDGNVPLNGVVIDDAKLSATPIACTPAIVPVGGTANCGPVTYVITAADETAGNVINSATATGTPPGGTPVTSPPSTTDTPVTPANAALTFVKSAGTPVDTNANGITDAGDTIAYTFAITNNGNVPLNNVVVNDARLSATPIACTPATVPANGGTAACGPVTYTITAADETAGSVDNSATATGTPPGGTPVTSPPSTTSTPVTAPAAALTLVKTAGTPVDTNANGITDAGDTIAYTFLVTNIGNVPVNGVVVDDAKLSATPIACAPANVPVGGTANCGPVSYVITTADETAGSVDNSATATGTPPGGTPVTSDPSTTSTPVVPAAPSLTLVKTAGTPVDTNANGVTDAGDTIAYTFVVTNTGNVPVDGVVVDDAKLSATPIACTPSTVPVGGTANCGPVSYVITMADETAGSVDNSATATGTPPGGTPVTSPPSTTSTPVTAPAAALTLAKSAGTPVDTNANGITDAGDTIAYSFVVTNTGNVPVDGVVIDDAKLSVTPIACTPATVPVGGTASCGPVVYVITKADEAAGSVDNSATATGTPPGGTPVTSPPSTTSTPVVPAAPSLTLAKAAGTPVDTNANGITDAGDTIAYSFVVTNTGNVPVDGVVINDAKLSATPIACTPATVPVGGTASCGPVVYVITTADEAAGSVDNSATATGTPPGGTPVTSPPSTTSTPVTASAAALTLVKSAGTPVDANANGITDAGDTIAYSFVVTNAGNVPVDGVVIDDAKLSATPIACTPATVPVGGTANCGPVTYTITAADATAGSVDNSATATGTPPGGTPVTSPPSTTSTPVTAAAPSLTLAKSADAPVDANGNGLVDAGDTIAYRFVATNTGNVALNGVVVNDAKISPTPIACTPATLAPDATANCGPVSYTITAADVTAGSVDNSATATGTPPGDTAVASDPSTTSTPVTAPAPSLRSQKQMTGYRDADADGQVSVGDTLTYVITVTNTGNVALIDVTITDARLTPNAVTCGSVAPNATCVLTGTYVVSQGDADGGQIVNTAVVTTQPRPGGPVLPPEACPVGSTDARCAPSTTVPVTQRPGIATSKTATLTTDAGTQGVGNVGDVITYAVTATNTGNVTLFNVGVMDSLEGAAPVALDCAPTTLAPGGMATCQSYTHTVTAAEANAGGTLDNVVTASGQTDGGSQPVTVTATGGANVRVEADPTTIRVVKTASPRDVKTGDLVRYSLSIQNTGTADLVDGTLVDTPPPGFNYVDGSLAVADRDAAGRLVGTSPIRVDQLDIAGGERATITYLLRVSAGVRPGFHTNSALVQDDGRTVSNVATADVQMVSDPVLDESLILGTVFDDRDSDGWQDSAAITGLRVQGGFAADAYVPDSTNVIRGDTATPEADASAPLLHGVALGQLSGRQSDADPVAAHTVVVRQTLKSLAFTDDFALTTKQGITVRMDAAGKTRIERDGDAAKGLNAADPTVERRVSQVLDGYRVDYVIANAGIDERGIPGVRIASVEGLLVETDQFGRYHLLGIEGGSWERGRNFILKVDPATLPPGTVFTTDNPLLRRVTPGLPVRFDFGAKLPPGLVEGGEQAVEMELGTVLFDPGSATLRTDYLPVVDAMAEQVRVHGGGEVLIAADGDSEALAYERAKAVQAALLAKLTPQLAAELQVSLRTDLADPSSTLLTLGETPVLGTVLFDTDQAAIKPQYAAMIDRIADDVAKLATDADKPIVVGVVGHADSRGSDGYNVALGLRRAKAVFDAIAAKLEPEVRSQLRVDISDSPTAPVGIRGQ